MATAPAVVAVIRAARPTFRDQADRLAFALHAVASINGLRLLAVGDAVDEAATAPIPPGSDEASLEGWNASSDGLYAFLYSLDAPQQQGLLMVKALAIGKQLAVTLLRTAPGAEPATLELDTDRYCSPDPQQGAASGYLQLEELVGKLQKALEEATQPAEAATSTASKAASAAQPGTRAPPTSTQQQQRRDPLREEPRNPNPLLVDHTQPRGGGGLRPPGWDPTPMGIGGEDRFPGGLQPPGMGVPGMGGPMMPGGVGGMHVGPGHPFFSDRLRHPELQPPNLGGRPGPHPGVRWDPINPEGLQGWNPDDFTPDRVRQDGFNDIGRPGPGRGTDWDEMYG